MDLHPFCALKILTWLRWSMLSVLYLFIRFHAFTSKYCIIYDFEQFPMNTIKYCVAEHIQLWKTEWNYLSFGMIRTQKRRNQYDIWLSYVFSLSFLLDLSIEIVDCFLTLHQSNCYINDNQIKISSLRPSNIFIEHFSVIFLFF